MRALLWILLFATACAALALYQSRVTRVARAERDAIRGAHDDERELEGFGHAIVGEASGAPLVEPPARVVPPGPGQPNRPNAPPGRGAQAQHVVKHGESLSTICLQHYGTGGREIVAALARFNRLADVDAIREGQTLAIPPLGTLNPPAR